MAPAGFSIAPVRDLHPNMRFHPLSQPAPYPIPPPEKLEAMMQAAHGALDEARPAPRPDFDPWCGYFVRHHVTSFEPAHHEPGEPAWLRLRLTRSISSTEVQ